MNIADLDKNGSHPFESLLATPDPIAALRAEAVRLSAEGLKRGEIYNRFMEFRNGLEAQKRENEVV